MPKISVVMPVYNGEKYLREAMDSILNQTFTDFEFIIINDASKDSTEEIIKSYNDERIVYLKNEQNLGVAGTLNRGLEAARGKYIARMDADDISMPDRFEKQVAFMDKHPEIGVCGAKAIRLYEDGEEEGYTVLGAENVKINMLFAPCIAHPVVMIRRSILQDDQFRYDEFFEKIEDYDLWCRINEKHEIDNVPEILFKYRIHSGQVTQVFAKVQYEKLVELKRRLLNRMNVEYTEQEVKVFVDIGRGVPISEVQTAKAILEKIYISNMISKNYNHRLLGTYLKNILFGIYSTIEKSAQKDICLRCEFISNKDIFMFKIKNIIGRGLRFKR